MPPEIAAQIAAGLELRRRGRLSPEQDAALAELERRYAQPEARPQQASWMAPGAPAEGPPAPPGPSRGDQARTEGRERAAERGRVGAAAQGVGSAAFGLGTPVAAADEYLRSRVPGGEREPRSWGESMEFARGLREGSYEEHPWAYRGGFVGGLGGAVRGTAAAAGALPARARSVFSLQDGQTWRNLFRLAGIGGAAAGTTAGLEQGSQSVAPAAAFGVLAAPLGVGGIRVAQAAYGRLSGSQATIARLLAKHLGEPVDAVATRMQEFIERYGRMPSLTEIARRRFGEEMGQVGRVRPGAGAIFREAEEVASRARPEELRGLVRRGGPTTTAAAQEAALPALAGEAAETLARSPLSTRTAEIGARNVRMNQVMDEIGDQMVPLTDDIRDLIQSPDVWSNLDPALRRGLVQAFDAGEALGTTVLPIRVWEAIRLGVSGRASGPGIGKHYSSLRNKIRDYAGERVPEYGAALDEFGARSEFVKGMKMGAAALTARTREFADAIRMAAGGTPDVPLRASARAMQQEGARVGARTELWEALSGPPKKALSYMTRLARDPALRANLRAVLSPSEVSELEAIARRYGRRLDIAAGARVGSRVTKPGTDAFQEAVAEAQRTPAGRFGADASAREAVSTMVSESPAKAVSGARRLAESDELLRRIESVMGVPEAQRLRGIGRIATRAAENLQAASPGLSDAALAAQAASQKVQGVFRAIVIAGKRASGALIANFGNEIVQRLRLSEDAAKRLAVMATDPKQLDKAIALMRKYGVSPEQIATMYQRAAVATGIAVGTTTQ